MQTSPSAQVENGLVGCEAYTSAQAGVALFMADTADAKAVVTPLTAGYSDETAFLRSLAGGIALAASSIAGVARILTAP